MPMFLIIDIYVDTFSVEKMLFQRICLPLFREREGRGRERNRFLSLKKSTLYPTLRYASHNLVHSMYADTDLIAHTSAIRIDQYTAHPGSLLYDEIFFRAITNHMTHLHVAIVIAFTRGLTTPFILSVCSFHRDRSISD